MGTTVIDVDFILHDPKPTDDLKVAHAGLSIIPRKGETVWLHTHAEGERIQQRFGTTSFIVVKVCYWVAERGQTAAVHVRPCHGQADKSTSPTALKSAKRKKGAHGSKSYKTNGR